MGFNCASISESKLALSSCRCGSDDDDGDGGGRRRCVYANPQRSESELTQALHLGVEALTFNSIEEIHKISRIQLLRVQQYHDDHQRSQKNTAPPTTASPAPPEMIIRLLVPDASSSIPLGEKFGASPPTLPFLIHTALDLHNSPFRPALI